MWAEILFIVYYKAQAEKSDAETVTFITFVRLSVIAPVAFYLRCKNRII